MSRSVLVPAGAAAVAAAAAAGAYAVVGGLPGLLYAAGILLLGALGALSLRRRLGGSRAPAAPTAERRPRWRRKSTVIAELEAELAELEVGLAAREALLLQEREQAHSFQAGLQERIGELEAERDRVLAVLEQERAGFHRSLEALTGGIGQRNGELAALERELATMIGG